MRLIGNDDGRRGSVLVFGIALSLLLLLTMAAAFKTTFAFGKNAQFELERTGAVTVAEGVLELAMKNIRDQASNFEPPDLQGVAVVGGKEYSYEISEIDDPWSETAPDGVISNVQRYVVTTTVELGSAAVTLERVVDLASTPVFQFMIYFAGDLELLPGPDMTLSGRVHANGDIYVGSGNTLTVDTETFNATGGIYRERKNNGAETGGTVRIRIAGETGYADLMNQFDSEYADWTTYATDTWKGAVKDGSHGITEVAGPDIGSIKAYAPDGTKGYYHQEADLVIVDNQAYDNSGNLVDLTGAITEKTMYDAREGKWISVTEVDIAQLNASGGFPSNGLLYAYRTDASPTQPNGIRLVNGAELAGPLTLVSEDPVYVQGDFNVVNKKGAAVIADAVNLLSNSWSDTGGTMQTATETTYNMAFVTGNVPTPDGGGTYSGGFENLPRFHERWSGVRANISGSFVNMFESEIATAPWGSSGVYTAPIREWHYDPGLINPDNLPPFTPIGVSLKKLLWNDGLGLPFVGN